MSKLRLIDAGLLKESEGIDLVGTDKLRQLELGPGTDGNMIDRHAREDDVDVETLIRKRNKYVHRSIRNASKPGKLQSNQIMAVAQARRAVVHDFMKIMIGGRKCNSCKGYTYPVTVQI